LADVRTDQLVGEAEREQTRLGAKLREAREYLGLSQEFVAEQLSIPRASISAIETGKRKVSSLELRDFARLYKRPVGYFLGGDQEDSEEPEDETVVALYRTTRSLNQEDRQQVLRFAQFLKGAGKAPAPSNRRSRS
jgi:transcriptional regulator with XRE-family HTH domain